jgi:hypothetical protein
VSGSSIELVKFDIQLLQSAEVRGVFGMLAELTARNRAPSSFIVPCPMISSLFVRARSSAACTLIASAGVIWISPVLVILSYIFGTLI